MGPRPRNGGGAKHQGTPQTDETSDNQQPTRKGAKERKNWLVEAGTMVKQKKKQQNKANQAQSGEQNSNQPDQNGGDLPCGRRHPLNVAADPPNPPPSIFKFAEAV